MIKPKLLLAAFLLLVAHVAWGQVTFQKLITSNQFNEGKCVQQTNDSGYIIAGVTADAGHNPYYAYLVKMDYLGNVTWAKYYKNTNSRTASSVQQTYDNGYIIAGLEETSAYDRFVFVMKTDNGGGLVWTKTLPQANKYNAYCVRQTSDSGYIVTGTARDNSYYNKMLLIKLDKTGKTTWSKMLGNIHGNQAFCVRQTTDGGYILCGGSDNLSNPYPDIALLKTDASGTIEWVKRYSRQYNDLGRSVRQTSDGGYIIAAYTDNLYTGLPPSALLIKTNSKGDTLWTRNFTSSGAKDMQDVEQTTDGGYIFAGTTVVGSTARSAAFLIKTDSYGDTLWTKSYWGGYQNSGYSVRQTKDGGYIMSAVAGDSIIANQRSNLFVVKTDANGNSGCIQENIPTNVSTFICDTVNQLNYTSPADSLITAQTDITSGDSAFDICLSVSIPEPSVQNTLLLYPNPAQNELIIGNGQMKIKSIEIYNVLGEAVLKSEIVNPKSEMIMDVSMLSKGLYFLRAAGKDGLWTGRFVKE